MSGHQDQASGSLHRLLISRRRHRSRSCPLASPCEPWRASDRPCQAGLSSRRPSRGRPHHRQRGRRRQRQGRRSLSSKSRILNLATVRFWSRPGKPGAAEGRQPSASSGRSRRHSAHPCHLIMRRTDSYQHHGRAKADGRMRRGDWSRSAALASRWQKRSRAKASQPLTDDEQRRSERGRGGEAARRCGGNK